MSDANRKIVNEAQISAVADTVTGLFSTLADTMPQMVWATDANGSHFYFNKRWYEYTGLSEEESKGFGFATVLHPDDIDRTLIAWRGAWEENAPYEIEYRFRRQDGVYRWFVARAMPVRDSATGQVRMWVGTCTDIDDTRRAYDELRESQGRLSVAIQSARLGLWEYEFGTDRAYFVVLTRELFGLTEDRPYSGAEIDALVHEDDQEHTRTALARVISGEDRNYQSRYRIRRADKTIRYAQSMATCFNDEKGNLTRLVGVVQDVTETQNTLDALRESAEALRESESLFRSVITNAPIIVFMLDKAGRITLMEGAALKLINRVGGEKVGVSIFDLYADELEIQQHVRHALAGENREWVNSFSGVMFETHVSPIINASGEQEGVIGVSFDITERSRAADELAAREEQYRFLFNTVASGVVYQGADGQIQDANPAAEQILGLTLAQMQGRDSLDPRWRAVRVDETDFPGEEHPVSIALRTGQTIRNEPMGVFNPAEERYHWLSVSAVPLFKEGEDKPGLVYAYFEDQTEQREAERRLRESEERFRALADNITQLAWMADSSGSRFWYNQRWLGYTGTTIEEMIGFGWQKVHHPDYVEPVTVKFMDHVQRGEPWEDTFPLRGKDGEYRWFLSRAVPIRDESGNILRWFGTNTDITESRQAEELVRRSEERFRSLVEATSQIVWNTRADGMITRQQPNWSAFTGQSWDEYKGSGWMNAVHQEDREQTQKSWQEAIAGQSVYSMEHRLCRADGQYRYMSVRAVPVLESSGTVREWIGVHTDITEQKEAEIALERYASQQAKVAETLQRSLLNSPPPRAFAGLTVSTHYVAALEEAQVGGDFFDVFGLEGGKVAFVLGDVTGKGIQAAEHTGQIKYALRAFLRENGDPTSALHRVNRLLCEARQLDAYRPEEDINAMAAVVVAVLETTTGHLTVAGGGAESPLIYKAATGDVEEVRTLGTSVGAYEDSIYEAETRILNSGDLLLMATDGITEARRGRREFFGTEGFAQTIAQTTPTTTEPEAVAVAVIESARAFSNNGTFRDDVCLLAVRRD